VAAALMTELVRIAPDRNIFAKLQRENGSPSGFLKAIGDRYMAEQLARNEVPAALLSGQSEAVEAYRKRRQAYLLYD
jgi:hypothetical protein